MDPIAILTLRVAAVLWAVVVGFSFSVSLGKFLVRGRRNCLTSNCVF
jgi:hypothetical protein